MCRCPIFKVLTYYGSAKARKNLRVGWSKLNSFHICITSYQLIVQDAVTFRRKQWYYLILDEAHNIKNFKSQRWQTLLNFNSQRRLLLTGTPLQNSLMELWSLMHFLMPYLFRSRKVYCTLATSKTASSPLSYLHTCILLFNIQEFSFWFSNPLNNMVEGNRAVSNDLIGRLHSIMRPFLLRRLKIDVEKQLPPKVEHIVMCKLSKRQQLLYEEYMSRSSTRASMSGGNFLGMMNILMQLRKVYIFLYIIHSTVYPTKTLLIICIVSHLFRFVIIQICLKFVQLYHHFNSKKLYFEQVILWSMYVPRKLTKNSIIHCTACASMMRIFRVKKHYPLLRRSVVRCF